MEELDKALTVEELNDLKPCVENLFENTRRAKVWYNEAVWTAATLFIEAAKESTPFRESFLKEERRDKQMESGTVIKVDKWRDVMEEEVPEYHSKLMDIGLSAAQGCYAERVARKELENQKT